MRVSRTNIRTRVDALVVVKKERKRRHVPFGDG